MSFGQNSVTVLAKNEFLSFGLCFGKNQMCLNVGLVFIECIPPFSSFAKADFGSLHCQYTTKANAR